MTDIQSTTQTGSQQPSQPGARGAFAPRGGRPPFRKGGRDGAPNRFRRDKPKPEYDQKMIDVRRVARVVAGGRRFSFSVALVAGDRKGKVGVGTGKGGDTASAIEKAMRSAKKNMINIKMTSSMSIPHEVSAKYASGRVLIKPVPGRGLVAGSSLRNVLDLAGVKDVVGKVLSPSKNKLNIARATIESLKKLRVLA